MSILWNDHPRGTICVLRSVRGGLEALSIEPQTDWTAWAGTFSII